MRIAWFTPLSTRSAIGEFSVHVTAKLAKLADVELWTSDSPPYHATDVPVVAYSSESDDLRDLAHREAIVYNMGDYLPFHGHIDAVSRRNPGIVILHDRVLHHLYAGLWLTEAEQMLHTYVERMRAHYGELGATVARESLAGERQPIWECDEEVLEYPLYEEAILNARGVITHSERQAADIRAGWIGPVRALHLPCYGEVLERAGGAVRASTQEPIRIMTVGHVNPNKQVHRVLEMIAADDELSRKVHYTIVGPDDGFVEYVSDLRRLADHHAGRVSVEILGWRPQEELDELMGQADLFVNLRHPVMEGSSASLMQQLAYARPVLCFDSGFFGELPADAVARVPAGDFSAAAASLRELVADPESRQNIGRRARALAASYNEHSYAEGLYAFIEESRHATPGLRVLDLVSRELGQMNVTTKLPIFDEIANDFGRILSL